MIAAGGIADGRTLAAVLATGADGAWIGTGFRAVTECREIDQKSERQSWRLIAAAPSEAGSLISSSTRRTVRAWPRDIANRTARTPTVEHWHGREDALQAAIEMNPAEFAETPPDEKAYLFSDATGFIQREDGGRFYVPNL